MLKSEASATDVPLPQSDSKKTTVLILHTFVENRKIMRCDTLEGRNVSNSYGVKPACQLCISLYPKDSGLKIDLSCGDAQYKDQWRSTIKWQLANQVENGC